jgi:hypothetical protein
MSHAGQYYCRFKNGGHAGWSNMNIYTTTFEVSVIPCMYFSNLNYLMKESDCIKGITIEIDEAGINNGQAPFTYKLYNQISKDTAYYASKTLDNIHAGIYDLFLIDQNQCKRSLNNFLYFPEQVKCDVIITPNGDGDNDQYFINLPGQVKIYDANGTLIRTLNSPVYWGGQNDSGELVPMGAYVILIEGRDVTNITVIR